MIDKTALRARLRALRRSLADQAPDAGRRAAQALPLHHLPVFETFSGYVAMGSEIDPLPLMRRLAEAGARCLLPAAKAGEALEFRAWDFEAPLEPDSFGIPSPQGPPMAPNLVIAPLLAFDRKGGRLGQGAGHYDRTLAALKTRGPVFVLGLAYAGQEVDELPQDPHDQRLDAILTEIGYSDLRQG